ncbi:hypothetical protein QBC33DRAFT_55676 [Phialemonium atrogriseum]|uniref:Uncharacterized protein n=1 Tax=Phialemonium atrogriseum TaxID=1093897 RepID=A0AAJ0C068_9PEZI|nr:uncharacterized protein QBC33DRAFT_55676 [Phialemonium atrogriseum]KAK1767709.1 hypothetical protein QBC33DRAFT_55676 [Phialemonium atrogriseum]
MASGQVFDPLVLLRVAPLVTSSFSLWYCVDQHMFYNNFIIPTNRAKGNDILPSYWKSFLAPGLGCIFSLYGLSGGAAIANTYAAAGTSRWYGIGAVFTAAHFLFVPAVSKAISAMIKGENKGDIWKHLQRWLRLHALRSIFIDFPGWLCFLTAAMQSLKAA